MKMNSKENNVVSTTCPKICLKIMKNKEQTNKPSEDKIKSNSVKMNQVKHRNRLSKTTITKVYTNLLLPLYSSFNKTKIYAALVLADNNLYEARLLLDFKNNINNFKTYINATNELPKTSANVTGSNPNPNVSLIKKDSTKWLEERRTEKAKKKVGVVIRKNAGGYQAGYEDKINRNRSLNYSTLDLTDQNKHENDKKEINKNHKKKIMSKTGVILSRKYFSNKLPQYLLINKHLNISFHTSSNCYIPNSDYCWRCGIKRNNSIIFCEKCKIIQKPKEQNNYFKIMGVAQGFNIDQKMLKDKFKMFQSLIHPDKYSNSSDEEKTISEEYSSLINKAYSNLMSPMKRAEHLLKLNGENINESQTIDDPDFLMKIMTINEEVENTIQDIEKLKELDKKNKTEIEELTKELDKHFQNQDIKAAKKLIVKLKYFTSINNRISSIFREAGIID